MKASDMTSETLLRCLLACFVAVGGVPWVVTTDNMKTITLGRDATNQPIWHPAFQKCAAEFGFHPAVCTTTAANQKGAVESLVKFVKGNFLIGRTFYDAANAIHTSTGVGARGAKTSIGRRDMVSSATRVAHARDHHRTAGARPARGPAAMQGTHADAANGDQSSA